MSGATAATPAPDSAARPDPSARGEGEEGEDEGRRRRMRRPRVAINSIELLDGDDDAGERGVGPDGAAAAAVAPGQGGCRGRAEEGFCAGAS